MTTTSSVRRPRVLGIVIFCLLGGAFNIWSSVTLLNQVNDLIALGVLQLASGGLLLRYKRIGLYLGGFFFVVVLVTNIYAVISGAVVAPVTAGWIALPLWALYYIHRYLTQEPQRTFFS